MNLIDEYLADFEYSPFDDFIETEVMLWYVGHSFTISQGIKALYKHLEKRGEMLSCDPEIVDYLQGDKVTHVILNKPVSKLEYIEKQYLKQVDKNSRKRSKL